MDLLNSLSNSLDRSNLLKNNDILNFTKELANHLNNQKTNSGEISLYELRSTKITCDTECKISDAKYDIIHKHLNNDIVKNSDDQCIYMVGSKIGKTGDYFMEKHGQNDYKQFRLNEVDLPPDVKRRDFLIKSNDAYVKYDDIKNEIVEMENTFIKEQKEFLDSCRIEGAHYIVYEPGDGCMSERARLINKETGQEFEEINLEHELYHQIGADTELIYKNGKYTVVEGTSIKELYPDYENYCEIDGSYYNEKVKPIDKQNVLSNIVTDLIKTAFKFIQDKFRF